MDAPIRAAQVSWGIFVFKAGLFEAESSHGGMAKVEPGGLVPEWDK